MSAVDNLLASIVADDSDPQDMSWGFARRKSSLADKSKDQLPKDKSRGSSKQRSNEPSIAKAAPERNSSNSGISQNHHTKNHSRQSHSSKESQGSQCDEITKMIKVLNLEEETPQKQQAQQTSVVTAPKPPMAPIPKGGSKKKNGKAISAVGQENAKPKKAPLPPKDTKKKDNDSDSSDDDLQKLNNIFFGSSDKLNNPKGCWLPNFTQDNMGKSLILHSSRDPLTSHIYPITTTHSRQTMIDLETMNTTMDHAGGKDTHRSIGDSHLMSMTTATSASTLEKNVPFLAALQTPGDPSPSPGGQMMPQTQMGAFFGPPAGGQFQLLPPPNSNGFPFLPMNQSPECFYVQSPSPFYGMPPSMENGGYDLQYYNLEDGQRRGSMHTDRGHGSDRLDDQSNPNSALFRGKHKKSCDFRQDEETFDIDLTKLDIIRKTTLMIKNIPNKYNQHLLLQTIDILHKNHYDFFYLPIDFKNKCNVGYAFINFVDPKFIKPFYEEFNGQKWEKFNSEKICEIKYARIQGRDGLVQHFKYSSVMNQSDKKLKPIILPKGGLSSLEVLVLQQKAKSKEDKQQE